VNQKYITLTLGLYKRVESMWQGKGCIGKGILFQCIILWNSFKERLTKDKVNVWPNADILTIYYCYYIFQYTVLDNSFVTLEKPLIAMIAIECIGCE